jgi:hypothetical protein
LTIPAASTAGPPSRWAEVVEVDRPAVRRGEQQRRIEARRRLVERGQGGP